METMDDIHNYRRRLENELKRLQEATDISEKNKKAILDFNNFCFSSGIGRSKNQRYVFDLKKLARYLNKDFEDCKRQDILNLIAITEQTTYAYNTKRGFRIVLKKFYKWLRNIEDKGIYPDEVKWITTTSRQENHRLPEELLTEEDIIKMIDHAKTPRQKAFVAVLYESGCRVGEILTLKIKNVAFDNLGAKITVFGKTGSRRVRLVSSESYLKEWLNLHPGKNNPESYLWTKSDGRGKMVSYTQIRLLLKRNAKRAGILKRINPHSFRHARASYLANHLTESQLKEVFGWTQGSKMAAVYVHLSGRDTDSAILKVYGKKIEEDKPERSLITPKICTRCKTENEFTNRFCKICGMALDEKEISQILKQEIEVSDFNKKIGNLTDNPEFLEILMEKLKSKIRNEIKK